VWPVGWAWDSDESVVIDCGQGGAGKDDDGEVGPHI
jgi:hypothetical protein